MSNIIEAIDNEEISTLNALLTTIECTQVNSQYIFRSITHIKPKSTEAIFKHCNYSFINATNQYNNHPLKTAIYTYKNAKEHKKADALFIVELTIRYSDNIDVKDKYFNTPLMTAAYENITQAVGLLLRANADHTVTDDLGNTALDKALWAEHTEIVIEFLTMMPRSKTPLLFLKARRH